MVLPEHNCTEAEHCLGCCPGYTACDRPGHQPPGPGSIVFAGVGIWNSWTRGPGPQDPLQRVTVYGPERPPMMGGPSR